MNCRPLILRRVAGIGVIVLLSILAPGCATERGTDQAPQTDPGASLSMRQQFPGGASFDYQLGEAYPPPDGTAVVVLDRSIDPEPGLYSVCYVNAFQTQPGELADWPEDLLLRDARGTIADPDWPDEVLFDTATAEKRDKIVDRIGDWIRGCASDGFQAVELDNLDSFVRSRHKLSFADNLSVATDLARVAHRSGLAVGQKNAAEHARELRDTARFDFAVSEECAAFEECDAYTQAYGKAVIAVEYTDALPRSFAEMCADQASPEAMILRDRNLVAPDQTGYRFERCRVD